MTGRNPRTEKTRDYRRHAHGLLAQCEGHLPVVFAELNGWPAETRVRCHRRIGVANGYCPAHRNQNPLEAVWDAMTPQERDAATARVLTPDPDFHHRLRHEAEEGYRDAMIDAGRSSLIR
jgi:hypothetical protein